VEQRVGRGFSPDNPYAFQYHYYNNTQPENLAFLERLRALLDEYPDSGDAGRDLVGGFAGDHGRIRPDRRLHMGYSFELLTDDSRAPTSATRSKRWKRR
jgi:alpha-glucosidase